MTKRVVSTPAELGQATKRRTKFEAANPGRMATIADRPVGRESARTGRDLGLSPKLLYRLHGIEETTALHSHGQQELPGMSSVGDARRAGVLGTENTPMHQSRTLPDLAPAPVRWEDMHPLEQAKTLKRAREFGVTPESMHHSFGAQVDQAHLHAQQEGQTPYAAHFYAGHDPSRPSTKDAMQPRDVLLNSARQNNVDFSTQAVTNGITSPKSKFRMRTRAGETVYPNDQAASFAIKAVQGGTAPEHIDPAGHGIIALHGNVRRAGYAVQQRQQGAQMADVHNPPSKSSPQGSSIFGPKTGPYTNSWLDPHGSSQFLVSDVHTGGGGMAPHISHESPYKRHEGTDRSLLVDTGEKLKSGKPKMKSTTIGPDHPQYDQGSHFKLTDSGKKKKDSSEREKYLDIPGIHSLHDHVARQVMHERGLQSLSGTQATQWGEEQAGRGMVGTGSARKQTLVAHHEAYPPSSPTPQLHGQMDIFGGESRSTDVAAHRAPLNTAQFEEPTGKDRDRAEAKSAAIQRNIRKKRGNSTYRELGNEPYEGWG